MATLDVVVVAARTNALNDEGLDGLDSREAVDGSHRECVQLTVSREWKQ